MKKLESRVYKGKWDLVIFFSPLGRAPNPGGFGNADKMFDKIRLDDLKSSVVSQMVLEWRVIKWVLHCHKLMRIF